MTLLFREQLVHCSDKHALLEIRRSRLAEDTNKVTDDVDDTPGSSLSFRPVLNMIEACFSRMALHQLLTAKRRKKKRMFCRRPDFLIIVQIHRLSVAFRSFRGISQVSGVYIYIFVPRVRNAGQDDKINRDIRLLAVNVDPSGKSDSRIFF
jgi:hypothetical protein